MQEPILILTAILVIIGVITVIIMLRQGKEKSKEVKINELKASLPPDFKFTKMRFGELLDIVYDITGRSEIPIKLQKITLKTWDKNNSQRKYPDIEQVLDVELDKDKTIHGELLCPRNLFETNESKNVEGLKGSHLFKNTAGELCLFYLDFNGNVEKKCEKIDRLMSE